MFDVLRLCFCVCVSSLSLSVCLSSPPPSLSLSLSLSHIKNFEMNPNEAKLCHCMNHEFVIDQKEIREI